MNANDDKLPSGVFGKSLIWLLINHTTIERNILQPLPTTSLLCLSLYREPCGNCLEIPYHSGKIILEKKSNLRTYHLLKN